MRVHVFRHLDVSGRAGCQEEDGEVERESAPPHMHTVQPECTCVFSHNGDFSALISANSVASPAELAT